MAKKYNPSKRIFHILDGLAWVGLVLIAGGFYVALDTKIPVEYGYPALRDDVILIGLGLLLAIPSKLIMTVKLMGMKLDEDE